MRALALCVCAACFFSAGTAAANPPSAIEVSNSVKTVTVAVVHPSDKPLRHYIKQVDLDVNGVRKVSQTYSMQDSGAQKAVYYVPELAAGDSITVTAACSISGSLTVEAKAK